jgi:hypothetical protein
MHFSLGAMNLGTPRCKPPNGAAQCPHPTYPTHHTYPIYLSKISGGGHVTHGFLMIDRPLGFPSACEERRRLVPGYQFCTVRIPDLGRWDSNGANAPARRLAEAGTPNGSCFRMVRGLDGPDGFLAAVAQS